MPQKNDRLYLDMVKGAAIILMLWGHCIQYCAKGSFDYFENEVFQGIYSFHMPLFMLVSGYLFFFSFQKRDLQTLLSHRIRSLLQPIILATVLNNLLKKLPTLLLHGQITLFDGALFEGMLLLWFLFTVLSSSTTVAVACKATEKTWLRLILVLLGVFVVALFPENELHLYMYPYFVAGFFWGMYREKIPGWLLSLRYLALPLFPVMLQFYSRVHFIYLTPVVTDAIPAGELAAINGFRWAIGLVGSVFAMVILQLVYNAARRCARIPGLITMIGKLGEHSLAIYCLSVSLLSYYLPKFYDRFLLAAGSNLPAENMAVYNFLFTPALTIAYCFGLYGVVLLMKKCRLYGLVFGR